MSGEGSMRWAVEQMAQHRDESMRVDRKGWTRQQWVADARRLMDDVHGSVTSLVNGHVMALLDEAADLAALQGRIEALHRPTIGSPSWPPTCQTCHTIFPCTTARALLAPAPEGETVDLAAQHDVPDDGRNDDPWVQQCPSRTPEPHLLGEFPMTCHRCHIEADS